MQNSDVEIMAVNDTRPRQSLVFFKRNSIHGTWPEDVSVEDSILHIGEREIIAFCERDCGRLPRFLAEMIEEGEYLLTALAQERRPTS